MKSDVTAIITVYNGADLISRSVDSVLHQQSPADELIVVDDGSTDCTAEILLSYGSRIRYIHQQNQGVAAARNTGVKHARSSNVAFLDHDDEWLPEKLERQMEVVHQNPSAALCYSAYWHYAIDGEKHLKHLPVRRLASTMRLRNPFPPSVVVVRTAEFLSLGGFNEALRGATCEDWEFFVRFLSTYTAVALDEPLVNYYELSTSNSRNYRQMLPNTLRIVDPTLLCNLSGIQRALWRRRIQSVLYYRAAISARELGDPAMEYLIHSISKWPVPDRRFKTLVQEFLGWVKPATL